MQCAIFYPTAQRVFDPADDIVEARVMEFVLDEHKVPSSWFILRQIDQP